MSEQSYFEEAARMHARLAPPMPNRTPDINPHLINHIHPTAVIDVEDLTLGVGVTIGANVIIKARKVTIGDFAQIGDGCKFFVPELSIGDYSRLGDLVLGIGTKPMTLGMNLYIGRFVRLDSRGGLEVQDNCGIGDSSAIWNHIRWGDIVQGCRWDKEYPLVIERDAWLVAKVTLGGCQRVGARAIIFNEANVTKREIPPDTAWAGNPLTDVTDNPKFGPQFEPISDDEKWARLDAEIARFEFEHPEYTGQLDGVFDPVARTYRKRRTAAEVAFLRGTLAKFTPVGEL